VAATVVTTGILWDPHTSSYGALKGVLLPLGALTAVLAAWARVRRGATWDLGPPTVAVLGLVLWAAASLCWAPSVASGLSDLTPALSAVALVLAGRVLLQGAGAARVLATAMAGSGLAASLLALADHGLGRTLISGTIGNPNHLAIYLAATGPALVWVAWSAPLAGAGASLRWRLIRLTAMVGPPVAAMGLSGCRSAWLAVGAGALVAVALTRPTRQRRWLALGLALLLCLTLGAAATMGPASWRKRLGGRLYLARISATLLGARTATGHGVGGFAIRFPEAQATRLAAHPEERPLWTNARTAHCEPLQVLVELGLVGGLLWLLVTALAVGAMVGGRGPPPPRRLVASASLVILGVSGLAEGSLHTAALLTLAAASAALLWEPGSTRLGSLHRASCVAVVLAFTTSAATVAAARHYAADRLVARAQLTASPRQRLALLRRATDLAPNPGRARFYLGLTLARTGQPEEAARCLRRSARDFPNLGTSIALGNVLMSQGRFREAAAAYGHAAWLHPRYAAAHHNLGLALQRLARLPYRMSCDREGSWFPGVARDRPNTGCNCEEAGGPWGTRRRAKARQAGEICRQRLLSASRASLRRARRLWPGRWLEPWRIRAIRRLIRPAAGPS